MQKTFAIVLILLTLAGICLCFADRVTPGGPIEAVLVEDAAHRTPAIGAIAASAQVRAFSAAHHVGWHVADISSAGPDLAEVQWALDAATAKKATLPVLVVRPAGGAPKILPLPNTPAATVAELAKFAG